MKRNGMEVRHRTIREDKKPSIIRLGIQLKEKEEREGVRGWKSRELSRWNRCLEQSSFLSPPRFMKFLS